MPKDYIIVEISGGCAEVARIPEHLKDIEVIVIDHDNINDAAGAGDLVHPLSDVPFAYLAKHYPAQLSEACDAMNKNDEAQKR